MFDEHLTQQHRLNYFVRGPEWAFAIPQGDLSALEDVMRRCSTFWNGAGSLLIPVRADGQIPKAIGYFLQTRPVDTCYTHGALTEPAKNSVRKRVSAQTVDLWDGFDEREIHPLHQIESPPSTPRLLLESPQFSSDGLRRVALATWGPTGNARASHARAS